MVSSILKKITGTERHSADAATADSTLNIHYSKTSTLNDEIQELPKLHTRDSFGNSDSESLETIVSLREIDEKKDGNVETTNGDLEDDNDDDIDFPEGGLRAWIVVFGCFLGLTACFGLLNTIGVIETHIQSHQLSNESSQVIGWVFSIFLFICFSSCIFSGTYFDRNGFKVPMIIGSACQVGGLFGVANSTKIWHFFLSLSVLSGFGNGIIMSPLVSAPSHYFKKRRGTATAVATMGGSLGGTIFPIILRKFFKMENKNNPDDINYGFIWGVRIIAFINLGLLIMSIILAKERIVMETKLKEGEPKWKSIIRVYILQSFDSKAFLDMKYFFAVAGTVFAEISLNSAVTYYGSYCTSIGISDSDAYTMIMTMNLCGIPGRYVPGYLSDHLGRFNISIWTLTSLGILMFVGWLPFGTSLTSMYVISALYGFFSGSIYSLLPVCIGQISKTEEFGKRYATMYVVVAFGTLIGIPITGAIIGNESNANYKHYIIFCGVMSLAGAACFVISRSYCVGLKLKKF
ncbi:hypothetical protein Kpol_1045p3 [Vanderwaltozyma polyspora DSM 70294]|uniref:Major facilitator superfamily (MFS) profile domain-containing protein n=1 Tax=Vanderwaltozyma polyspora (strain ATCC 22028 / DSM 70294 / BCRC 21397 / CBS 2163 / NBRC 10782 / NRRL Y-8283 / UCD 57-17) TaxID=436907 RepID=A7TI12_VANPO|nr:uncharacterized protein Kpol_1045p3 [Vanderwaltozyma polyspora DSM 70294]EDO18019.1 hypothetical protein Kpol_1045p3 [Vanderwaltozyma polyspora DSM 70294]